MKVLAKINGGNGFIVEVSDSEMAKLLGASSTYSDEYKKHKIEEGAKLNVSEVWDTMQHTKAIGEFTEKMIQQHRDQITKLEKIRFPKFLKPGGA